MCCVTSSLAWPSHHQTEIRVVRDGQGQTQERRGERGQRGEERAEAAQEAEEQEQVQRHGEEAAETQVT